MSDLVGQQWGSYRLTRLLGQGGFAEVYLAEHTRLKMSAAIKILYTHLSQEGIEAFQNEAQVIANLVHPNIVRLLDFDVKEGRPFLVLDYASNGSLRQRHPKGERVPLDLVVSYTKQAASALQFAHDQKLIHRDVKPENMLLSQQNTVLLSDFGIVAIAHSTSSMNVQSSMGTLPYMAPEQIQGMPRPASDQYALAITAYQWLSGNPPFQGNSSEIIAQHLGAPVPALRTFIPDISADVEMVLEMALAKDPKARFGSIKAFATALEQASMSAAQAQTITPTPVPASTPQPGSAPLRQLAPTFIGTSETARTPVHASSPAQPIAPTVAASTPPGYAPNYPPASTFPRYAAPFPPDPRKPARSSGKMVLKWGGIFGAGLIVWGLIYSYLLQPLLIRYLIYQLHSSFTNLNLWGLLINAVVDGIIYFCLGIVVSSKSGKVSSGVLACLLALACRLFVGLILTFVLDSRYLHINGFLQSLLIGEIINILIGLVLAAGLGVLGSLVGSSTAKKPYLAR